MNIINLINKIQTESPEYLKLVLDKEIDNYNERVDEDEQIDIFQVRNSMNNYNDPEELKKAIDEIKCK